MIVPLMVWIAVWIYLWNLDSRVKRLEDKARNSRTKDGAD